MADRISRDKMFMEIAKIVALRGTCDRAQVGAVLVQGKNIISIGYNGAPSGRPHCDDVGHEMVDGHCVRATHAEINCLDRMTSPDRTHLTLYVTHFPCMKCVIRMMGDIYLYKKNITAGLDIRRIVYLHPYRAEDEFGVREKLLTEVGVKIEQYVEE